MLHQFHKKMTLLYTFTTGIILSCVLLVVLIYSEKLINLRNEENFQSEVWTLVNTLHSDHKLSQSWLAQMETENDCIIHIEENGTPLLYEGSWTPATQRNILIQKARDLAARNSINTSIAPVSSDIQQSEIFHLTGDAHDHYQGIVIKLPTSKGFKTLILLHSLKPLRHSQILQRCLFILLDVLGVLALFFVSWNFVKKSLSPIQENQKKQEAFFAAASHELRSPIAVIQASANAITADSSKAPHLASNILSECHRLSRLTEDMLTLSRSNLSGWSVGLEELDLDTLLLDLYESFEPICMERKIPLSLSLPDTSLPAILGDTERLLQLLTILLDNAVSHSLENDSSTEQISSNQIIIQAVSLSRGVEIRIIDHGVGIPDAQKSLIFDHFYRGDASRGDKTHFGLGLGIAMELAGLHRGELKVSDTPGGGATFHLILPCSS